MYMPRYGLSYSALNTRLSESLAPVLMLNSGRITVSRRLLCSVRNSVMSTAFADLDFSFSIVLRSMCPNTSMCGASLALLNNKSSVLPAPAKKSVCQL